MSTQHTEEWLQNRRFGIVIDAGSSGSRIHIYSWIDHDHIRQTTPREYYGVLPTIEPGVESGSVHSVDWTKRNEPGIAEFKDRPEDVGEHLEPLLDHAVDVIPESEIARTPIYLLATAGLRLVQSDIREQILLNSCNYIREMYNFLMGDCHDHIKNISGEEEGIYGWVAINYLMGGFDNGGVKMIEPPVPGSEQHDSDDADGIPSPPPSMDGEFSNEDGSTPHRHTLGFLDMGGASTQIAFEPSPKASEEHFNDLTKVSLRTLDGKTLQYNVFVTTFLGYGSNEARRRYVKDYLLDTNRDLLETQKPGVQITIEDPCLPKHLQLSETHTKPHVPLSGSGSFTECLKRVEVLLNKDKECDDVPCLFNGVHTPPIDFNINTFIGVSEYWYSSHDILGLGGAYDYAEFERKSAEFCNTEWNEIKNRQEYQGQMIERLEMQCFKSAWLSNVLHSGFGLPRYGEKGAVGSQEQSNEVLEKAGESVKNKNWRPPFQSINAIKDIQVTWTLGAMLLISSGSLGNSGGPRGHRPTQHILPPADHKAPHEDTYPERMLDNYNHFVLLAIFLFALALFWVYRSRSSKSLPFLKRWLSPSSSPSGPSGGGLFGRFRRAGGSSGADFSALESGTIGGSSGSYGQPFSLKVMYLSIVHHTRSVWWSLSTRIWPDRTSFAPLSGRPEEEIMESITIANFDGTSNTTSTTVLPMSGAGSLHGGSGNGSFGPPGLSSIPEGGGAGSFEPGFHRTTSSTTTTTTTSPTSGASSRPPKTGRFFRINKKRFSGDSHSLFANKDGKPIKAPEEGCVVNTAILQKQPKNSVELTARSGSVTNLSSLWTGGSTPTVTTATNGLPPPSLTPTDHSPSSGTPAGSGVSSWRQGWIPEEEADDPPVPSLLSSSRSYNPVSHSSGHSPLLAPMARYKQQHQDGSSSAPSSTVNLAQGGSGSGFVTSADERDEWSADGGDGDDEGDGYHAPNSQSSYQPFQQQVHSFRPASAAPTYATRSQPPQPVGMSHAVPTSGSSRYKQRSVESDESPGDAGLLSTRVPSSGNRSPLLVHQQLHSTSTSSLVLGRHNVSEQDQQLVSRGSSETARRSSMGALMSP
ncbi:nucleoside phosphatase family-domain-containing protein [Mortierella sp. GBAus27b]|nr:nucleoside phosphatase family-domain-containing protein [Mortierella sp. GBAus27b]